MIKGVKLACEVKVVVAFLLRCCCVPTVRSACCDVLISVCNSAIPYASRLSIVPTAGQTMEPFPRFDCRIYVNRRSRSVTYDS
jgi:hypothetical protein